jgi:hypothetical protein
MFFIVVGCFIILAGIIGPYFLGDMFEKIKVTDPSVELEYVSVDVKIITWQRSLSNSPDRSRKNSSPDGQLEMVLIDQSARAPEVNPSDPIDLNSTYDIQAKEVLKS